MLANNARENAVSQIQRTPEHPVYTLHLSLASTALFDHNDYAMCAAPSSHNFSAANDALPRPRFVEARSFGCAACRDAFGLECFGKREIPEVFATISQQLGRPAKAWTEPFYACLACDAIWLLSYDPKEMMYQQTPTPLGTTRALLPEAQIEELMPLLFAWAPIDECAERALRELDYSAQTLWDLLVAAWRHPDIERNRQADILRQLARLVHSSNPFHQMQQTRVPSGQPLICDDRGFARDLIAVEQALVSPENPWRCFPYIAEHAAVLRAYFTELHSLDDQHASPVPASAIESETRQTPVTNRAADNQVDDNNSESGAPIHRGASTSNNHDAAAQSCISRSLVLLMPYWNFLPAMLIGWFLVEIGGSNSDPDNRWLIHIFFGCIVFICTAAGVALNAGVSSVGLLRTIFFRLSELGSFLLIGILLMLIVSISIAVAHNLFPDLSTYAEHTILIMCTVIVLIRLWPFLMVSFMQDVAQDIPTPHAYGITRQPALATAWRLTRAPGNARRFSLWLFAVCTGIGLTWLASQVLGKAGRSLILYPIVLPMLTAFTWALIEQIHIPIADSAEKD